VFPDDATIRTVAQNAASKIAGRPIRERQRLISTGMIDSLSVLRLISELEEGLRLSIPTESLQPEDFDDLDLIVETVKRVAQSV
jgi:acyl carrier protein